MRRHRREPGHILATLALVMVAGLASLTPLALPTVMKAVVMAADGTTAEEARYVARGISLASHGPTLRQ